MTPIYRTNPAPMAGNAPLQPMDPREQATLDELRKRRAMGCWWKMQRAGRGGVMRDLRQDPDFLRHYATVLIREAVARKNHDGDGSFCEFLLAGAERAHREADEIDAQKPAQGDFWAALLPGGNQMEESA